MEEDAWAVDLPDPRLAAVMLKCVCLLSRR